MPNIDLKTAVARIYQIVDQRRKRNLSSPFFFIAGAGVSNPPIPLAWEIEEQCKQVAQSYDDTNPPERKTTMDSYSHWMGKAYPSPEELQAYLRGLMENKPLSKANLRLAHLLLDGRLARTVFTPNFDDMLAKALELFGQRPLVCDHPLTVDRMWIGSDDIQIIHVHGSYRYYDCCNLRQDIADRSQDASMSMMLGQTLRDHSPLVVGYSGWDGDILMSSLQHRLSSAKLGTPAFWFCYERESLDALPAWLTQSNDIFFVLPDDPGPAAATPSAPQPSEAKNQYSPRLGSEAGTSDSSFKEKAATLTANRVLDALVHRFQLPAPAVTQNPLAFYGDRLRGLLGTSDPEGELDTYYAFHKVIARVERARDSEAAEQPDSLKGFREAMSKADYRGAIQSASQIALATLTSKEQTELVFALIDASLGLNDNSDDEIAGYDLAIQTVDLLAAAGSAELRLQEQVAMALFNKGVTLGALDRSEDAIAVYDDLVSRFADAKEPTLREQVATALVNKGVRFAALNRSEDAIAVFDDILRHFEDAKEPALQERVVKALNNKGLALGSLGRNEEAIAVYDGIVSRLAEVEEPTFREQVARAILNRALTYESSGSNEIALANYEEILARFGDDKGSAIEALVEQARNNRDKLRNEGETPA